MDFRRLFDIIPYQQARYPNKAALVGKEGTKWRAYSTAECLEQINRFSAGLLDKGFEKGQTIARVRNIFGDVIREYAAPEDGIIIGRSVNPLNQTGSRIVHLGIVK